MELHPHPLHSSAKGTRIPVKPIGYPHFLAPQSTSTNIPQKLTIYDCELQDSFSDIKLGMGNKTGLGQVVGCSNPTASSCNVNSNVWTPMFALFGEVFVQELRAI